jgi:hypothetical protein
MAQTQHRTKKQKKVKTKRHIITQDVTVNVSRLTRRPRNPSMYDKLPKIYHGHGRMIPDPERELQRSNIELLANKLIGVFNATHQAAINQARSIKVSSKAVQASVDPQARFAVPGPGQAPAEGTNPVIDLGTPEVSGKSFEAPNESAPLRQMHHNEGLDQAGPSQVPQPRGLNSTPTKEMVSRETYYEKKKEDQQTSLEPSQGIPRKILDEARKKALSDPIYWKRMGLSMERSNLESQSIPRSQVSFGSPSSVTSST